MTVVTKFGGSSMANALGIRQVAKILNQDTWRSVAVVSAAGVCDKYPEKVTDLLYRNDMSLVGNRLSEIMQDLGLSVDELPGMLLWASKSSLTQRVAFGEYMSAYILAKFLGWRFVDARRVFTLNQRGECMYTNLTWRIGERVVVPGFYGALYGGGIALFPRGGSDISGALIAAATGARLYENWTDVSGIYTADPRQHAHARHLSVLSYRQAKMRCDTGARVLHPDAIAPVARRGIPILIKNTFQPNEPGTLVGDIR